MRKLLLFSLLILVNTSITPAQTRKSNSQAPNNLVGTTWKVKGKTEFTKFSSQVLQRNHDNSILGVYTCKDSDAVIRFESNRKFAISQNDKIVTGIYRLQADTVIIDLMSLSIRLRFDGITITDADGKQWTKTQAGTPPPPKPRGQTAKSNFFTFELRECRQSGSSVSCEFVITNNDRDRYFDISEYQTLMYDDLGKESEPRSIMVAGKTGYNRISLLVSGVPTKAVVRFEGISPEATSISLLTISCRAPETSNGMGGEQFKIQFRNISLNR
jgi:hypothetical protein